MTVVVVVELLALIVWAVLVQSTAIKLRRLWRRRALSSASQAPDLVIGYVAGACPWWTKQ